MIYYRKLRIVRKCLYESILRQAQEPLSSNPLLPILNSSPSLEFITSKQLRKIREQFFGEQVRSSRVQAVQ